MRVKIIINPAAGQAEPILSVLNDVFGSAGLPVHVDLYRRSPDKFRIKIWDKATDLMVYDNQLGASDSAAPSTSIGGGSIIVHK